MCGIAGIISKNKEVVHANVVKKMTDTIAHRGPDGEGVWINEDQTVGLGHRRLSILDLSEQANQPMHFAERYTIVFNGEIYNYIELKEGLIKEGYTFKTTSDTEVLMALYDKYKSKCLLLLDGMFAFAIFDNHTNQLFCARDRFGEKPFFYYYKKGEVFQFASEMKALWNTGVEKKVSNIMLYNYLADGYLDNPTNSSETFFDNCLKLPHAHWLLLNVDTLEYAIEQYYDINYKNSNSSITQQQAIEQFQHLLKVSISRRLRSDVPVGSSLSGGLDSSLIVCLINQLIKGTGQIQKTFSAEFPGFLKDERKYMDEVINSTNVLPHFITPKGEDLINEIDKLLYHQEEPIGSASIYVQYAVMKLAKQNNVTVMLDGQGADEILAGYHFFYKRFFTELSATNKTQYQQELKAYQQLAANNNINKNVRGGLKGIIIGQLQPLMPFANKTFKHLKEINNPFFNKDFYHHYKQYSFNNSTRESSLNEALYNAVFKKGLQELLRYADRNSMAHGVEVRVPFLSHELIDFVFSLPATFKIHNGWTKWLMRESFKQVLPEKICWRKDKIGYEPPQKSWLENGKANEIIHQRRTELIQLGIVHTSHAKNQIESHDAVDPNNKAWKIWMAGNILSNV
jgi:asparagine synthase (glutamine-hydrolysing)